MTKRTKHLLIQLAMIIAYSCYVFYVFKSPNIINTDQLITLTGQLNTKPIYVAPTGDNVPCIRFEIIGKPSTYTIESCQLQQISIEKFLHTKLSDTISFSIPKDVSWLEKINSNTKVFQLQNLTTREILISINQVNSCEAVAWKELSIISIILIASLVFSFFESKKESVSGN